MNAYDPLLAVLSGKCFHASASSVPPTTRLFKQLKVYLASNWGGESVFDLFGFQKKITCVLRLFRTNFYELLDF